MAGEKQSGERPRRAKGTGSVPYTRKDGQVRVRVRRDGREYTAYARTEAAAKRKRAALVKALDDGLDPDAAKMTVEELLKRWLVAEPAATAKGREGNATAAKHLTRELGKVRLANLDVAAVEAMLRALVAGGLSHSTAARTRGALRNALRYAQKRNWLARNVAELADMPKGARPPPPKAPLTRDQVAAVLKAARAHRLGAAFVLAMAIGLRRGELCGLRWGDVDLDRGRLTVREQVQRTTERGRAADRTKTPASDATIPLPRIATDALAAHRDRQREERRRARRWHDGDYVFASRVGTPTEPRNLDRAWEGVRGPLGIAQTLHDLRRTCATLLHAEGVPDRDIQRILRHARIATTMDVYVSVYDDALDTAMAAMDRALADDRGQDRGQNPDADAR
jgi:integrase